MTRSERLQTSVVVAVAFAWVFWTVSVHASPPACFPERTVLWSALVVDEAGNSFAGVRAGQVVHVLTDGIGPGGHQAEIELRGPAKLRGRIERSQLLAFARGPIEIEPGASWLLAEAPLWVLSGAGERVLVRRAEAHGSVPRFPDAHAACAQLRGTPPQKLYEDPCHGATYPSPTRTDGPPVRFAAPPVLELASGRRLVMEEKARFGLLEVQGSRALVEHVDDWEEWVKVRGWTDAAGMKPVPRNLNYGYGHMCCEGTAYAEVDPERPIRRLRREAPIRAVPDGSVVGSLARGSVVQVLAAFEDQLLVAHEARARGRRWTGVSVRAWIAADAVSGPPITPRAIQGQLRYPKGFSSTTDIQVFARTRHAPWLRGHTLAGDRFEVPAPDAERVEVKVVTRDRKLLGRLEGAWRARELIVDLSPTQELAGTVVTEDGLPIPGAELALHTSSYFDLPRAITDASGKFTLRFLPSETGILDVSAPGFLTHEQDLTKAVPAVLKLRRAPVVAGAVGRDPHGACVEQEILTLAGRGVATAPDCTFALVREHQGVITVMGRRQRTPNVTLSPKGESPSAGSCSPELPKMPIPRAPEHALRCDVEGDVMDLCLGGEACAAPAQASIFVRVITRRALASNRSVEAFHGAQKVGECTAPSGACFIHHLPAGVAIEVRSRGDGQELSASVTPRPGSVVEVSLR